MYNLKTDGLEDWVRTQWVHKRKISYDPLQGELDGSNTVFYTTYAPIYKSGSITISGGSLSSVDYDTGTVILVAPPSSQPKATYYMLSMTEDAIYDVLVSGFDEMETRLPRGFRLSSSSVVYEPATIASENMYIMDANGNDPPLRSGASGSVWSLSPVQRKFYMACCEYVYVLGRTVWNAEHGFRYKEDRGALIDKSRVASNLENVLDRLEIKLQRLAQSAADEYYTDGEYYGGYVSSPATRTYMEELEWQTDSKDNDVRTNYAQRRGQV